MQAVTCIENVGFPTVSKLLVNAGRVCADYHDEHVSDIHCSQVQCDEIWSFVYAKQKNVRHAIDPPDYAGDVWTYTAIDPDSKLIILYYLGSREIESASEFLADLWQVG